MFWGLLVEVGGITMEREVKRADGVWVIQGGGGVCVEKDEKNGDRWLLRAWTFVWTTVLGLCCLGVSCFVRMVGIEMMVRLVWVIDFQGRVIVNMGNTGDISGKGDSDNGIVRVSI